MRLGTVFLVSAMAVSLGGCLPFGNDEGERYLQRKDTVTLSAGDAKEVNRDTQMEAAWPRGVDDRKIVANGQRMVGAVQNYRCGTAPTSTPTTSTAGSTPGGAAVASSTSTSSRDCK